MHFKYPYMYSVYTAVDMFCGFVFQLKLFILSVRFRIKSNTSSPLVVAVS